MGSIAKGLVFRVPAAAKADGCASTQVKHRAVRIDDFKISFNTN